MSKNVRNLMKSLADYVFPVGQKDIERYKSKQKRTGYEYVTNLPFQMLIYFNSFYAPFWIVGSIICLVCEVFTPELLVISTDGSPELCVPCDQHCYLQFIRRIGRSAALSSIFWQLDGTCPRTGRVLADHIVNRITNNSFFTFQHSNDYFAF
ncbi:uncharacterized protein DEA37_0014247 [Paragonimus westermani]|uniref:Uncharacterized protein n=1 Tax=Paragonimus westermani TaxID=34504 RepID=A0A5J4NBU7_9TREM|nr:uncharacterized protein DEA37_0014247 [Paragonimus westermani]